MMERNNKTVLSQAVGLVLGTVALHAHANLTSSATLSFTLGTPQVVACNYGTTPPCANPGANITDIVGSYFGIDFNANDGFEPNEKTPFASFNGIHLGTVQGASGSHTGSIDGSESPNIDHPWEFLGNVGMHQTTSPVTVAGGSGDSYTLDMSGWAWTWNAIPSIPLVQVGDATITCTAGSSCSDSSSYTLDAAFHFNGVGFTSAPYTLHLEGHVSSPVPAPAAAWLFGSGLAGLTAVSRRRKTGA